jgi:acyl-CoA thioesterase II
MPDDRPWRAPLDAVLRIEPRGDGVFAARVGGFGGETLGCATLAAARTCAGWPLHSLHTYFLRPVPTDRPIEIVVERVREGRRFAHRRVQIRMDERLCFELMASFVVPGGVGTDYQDARLDAVLPAPEALTTEEEVARAVGWGSDADGPVGGPLEWRWIGLPWQDVGPGEPSSYRAWVRPRFPLPEDRALNAAAVAFLSDYHSHFSVARKLGGPFEPMGFTSLDQVLWLHRDLPWDDWRLLTTESDIGHAGRGFTRRMLYTRDGWLVASMAQEQLIPNSRPST